MNKRRYFLKQGLIIAGCFILNPLKLKAAISKKTKITILHTNDIHSHIDAFDSNDPNFPNQGGLLNIYTKILEIRNKETNVLLFDCGDVFQGTPYFNLFGGVVEFNTMSKMGYNAGTIGNHDFDNGYLNYKNIIEKHSNFPILNANYIISENHQSAMILPYKIFEIENKKIGVFGIGIELKSLLDAENFKDIVILNPIECANKTAKILKKENCNFIICLSHLGFQYMDQENKPSDIQLAKHSNHIDMILGGHTHTFLNEPVVVKNLKNEDVVINQAGWAGLKLGRVDIEI
jgi:5'-nucleotidase